MTRSVREALGLVLVTEKAQRVIELALTADQRRRVPEEADSTREFVYGPLCRALESEARADDIETILERLEPILTMAGSHVRPREINDTPTLPPPPIPVVERLVLVSTLNPTSIQGLERRLDGRASVRLVSNVFDLISAIETHYDDDPMVIIDCSSPAVEPVSFAVMLPLDLDTIRVILWGATEQQRHELRWQMPIARHWVNCPSAQEDELAILVGQLLD